MSYGHGSTGGLCGPSHSLLALCCTTHCTTQLSSPLARPPPPFLFVLLCPRGRPLGVLLGSTRLLVGAFPGRVGGGGAPDTGSGPSLREFPHGGADACTPRQGVTLLYGPYICTRSVQMDLRRNQVRRPFPTPGSGTLWVSGESLRDRRVSCLPRWTVCPTRSPSQDTNRSTCRGECSWSSPLATPPGRCHLGPLANGPGRNPPYCLRSGGADTDTGGALKPLRSGTSPASFAGSCHPAPPPFAAVLVPASQLSSPGVSPFPAPLAVLPGSCRVPSAPAVCPCSGALVSFVFFYFILAPPPLTTRLSPRRFGLSSAPPPHVPSLSPRCPRPFLGWVEEKGVGGGASSLPILWRKHVASTVQARGAALVPVRGGGGACCFAPVVALPTLRSHPRWSPRWGLHGACSLRARSCGPSRTLSLLPPHPAALSSGGGPRAATVIPHPPGGGGVCGGGGGGAPLSSSLCSTHVAGTTQARRKHGVRHLAAVGGGGFSFGAPIPLRSGTSPASLASPCHPGLPPYVAVLVPASSLSSPGALVCFVFCFFFSFFVLRLHRPPPVSPPGASVCPLPPPHVPSPSPRCPRPFLGWVGEKGVGGGASSLSVLWRKHVASTAQARGAALVPLRGGGGLAVWLPSSPFPPCVRTPGAPPVGACTPRASYGHGRVVRPAPSLRCLPTLPLCPRGGGALSAPPYLHPPPLGGRRCVGGGGACRLPFVAHMSQARRKHGAGTRRGTCPSAGGGGGLALWLPSSPFLPCVRTPSGPPVGACTARALYGHGRVVGPAPSRRCLPTLPLCPRRGGRFCPPLPASPTLGGAEVCVGGGGLVVFPS